MTIRNLYTSTRRLYSSTVSRHFHRHAVVVPKRRSFLSRAKLVAQKGKAAKSSSQKAPTKRRELALLICAHNEELVLAKTIRSALKAGMSREDIYVVDDNSSDATTKIARSIVPEKNVIRVRRSGKGLGLTKGARRFRLTKRYEWIHIADADGAYSPDYFHIFREKLDPKYAAATGYVRSLPGRRISEFRVYEYTIGMEIHRRIQVLFNVMPVIPGPTSCFRWDVFEQVRFDNRSLTEDFDVTMQLHRQKLGKIQFIPQAIVYTQDPKTVKDFVRQINRWNRGGLQCMLKHKIGRRLTPLDVYLSIQVLQNLIFFLSYFVLIPYLAFMRQDITVLAKAFVADVIITYAITLFTVIRTNRWDVLGAFPIIYLLRWLSLGVFLRAFIEVVILRRFRQSGGTWENKRYVVRAS